MTTRATEDYLKTIYALARAAESGGVGTGAIAEALGVASPSATNMLKRLAAAGLVEHHPRRGVTLTNAGERIALEVIRHHRLLETYLTEALGFGWDEVHDEADQLEHSLSERLEARMDKALGYPLFDPHGDPIPTAEGQLPQRPVRSLASVQVGGGGIIARVDDRDPAKLRYLAELGLTPGAMATIVEALPFSGSRRVRIGGDPSEHLMGEELAAAIFIWNDVRLNDHDREAN
jgi:DtxR family Mn-dependent transcriptional regulator